MAQLQRASRSSSAAPELKTRVSSDSKEAVVPLCSATARQHLDGCIVPDVAFWISDIWQKADIHTAGLNLGK